MNTLKTKSANLARNIILFDELEKILKSFNDNEIDIILLKGSALALTVYDNIEERPMTDIDLLIKIEQFPKIEKELVKSGFVKNKDTMSLQFIKKIDKYNSVFIDLHHGIWYLNGNSLSDIWSSALKIKYKERYFGIMTAEDMLIHVLVHAISEHGNMKDINISDGKNIISKYGINWKKLIIKTRNYDLKVPVYIGLGIIGEKYGCIPDHVLKDLKPSILNLPRKAVFERFLSKNSSYSDKIGYFTVPLSADKIRNKCRHFINGLFPSREYLKYRYKLVNKSDLTGFYIRRVFTLSAKGLFAAVEVLKNMISVKT